jgi:hypothetical protein
LSHLATDESAPVRRAVCQAIVLLASFQLAVLEPLLSDICQFMLQAVMDPVSLSASPSPHTRLSSLIHRMSLWRWKPVSSGGYC